MSYQRPDRILTQDLLEYCTYVVRWKEEEAYRNAGVKELLVIPQGATLKDGTIVWSFMTTLYWIIENTPEDVIFIADDDIKNFTYRTQQTLRPNLRIIEKLPHLKLNASPSFLWI